MLSNLLTALSLFVTVGNLVALSSAASYLLSTAKVDIYPADSSDFGNGRGLGTLELRQYADDDDDGYRYVTINGELNSIFPISSRHGFHIHENPADPSTKCSALGPHYNPLAVSHGAGPNDDHERSGHVGDLGNIISDSEGNVRVNISDDVIQVGTGDELFDIAGRSFAIHMGTDDLGLSGVNTSTLNGNSGPIIACGTIVVSSRLTATATADMFLASDYSSCESYIGPITLRQYSAADDGNNKPMFVTLTGRLKSVFPGLQLHGFHVHEYKATDGSKSGCASIGNHFNPLGVQHGNADSNIRHVGDLGNIESRENGVTLVNIRDPIIQIGTGDETYDVVGRSLAVHFDRDDLGQGGTDGSSIDGNSGQILACGNILM